MIEIACLISIIYVVRRRSNYLGHVSFNPWCRFATTHELSHTSFDSFVITTLRLYEWSRLCYKVGLRSIRLRCGYDHYDAQLWPGFHAILETWKGFNKCKVFYRCHARHNKSSEKSTAHAYYQKSIAFRLLARSHDSGFECSISKKNKKKTHDLIIIKMADYRLLMARLGNHGNFQASGNSARSNWL